MPFPFLYFSWIILLRLNPEMRRFAYSRIRREDCEGTSYTSTIGEARVSASMLTSVGFCTLLEWITGWLRPRWWDTYPVERIEVSDLASIICTGTASSVMPLGAAWGSDPGSRSYGPGYRDSSYQASLGRGMIDIGCILRRNSVYYGTFLF